MPPKKAGGGKAKKTANGYRMPEHLDPGTQLTDLAKKQWILGKTVGTGGFGEIYLATEGGKGEERVVKIEPHENGPLFVEMHFYLGAGKPDHLAEYKKTRKGKEVPHLPLLRGHGSYKHKGDDNYRFLVIDKLGRDLDKIFQNGANPLTLGQVSSVSIQVLTTLEYIHSAGFTHNDVKAANLLFGCESNSNDIYLVDFGLCVKYFKSGSHKEYKADPRKSHDGTIEYLSRDAHIGCTSRRSDLEVLAFNMIHWLNGTLPWIKLSADPKKVQAAKEAYVKDLDSNIKNLPKSVQEFVKYSVNLKFDQEPDYDMLRSLFQAEVKKAGNKLNFGAAKAVKPVKESPARNSPVRKTKQVKKAIVDSQSEEDVEESPAPAKKSRRAVKAPVVEVDEKCSPNKAKPKKGQVKATQVSSASEEDDMFAKTPSPKKKFKAQVQEIGVQTSPAFVAAAKAAKIGKKALAQSEYVGDEDSQHLTPSSLRKQTRKKPAANGTPGRKAVGKSKENGDVSSNGVSDISNPTPAMLAILQKKQKAEAEKTTIGKKRKKT